MNKVIIKNGKMITLCNKSVNKSTDRLELFIYTWLFDLQVMCLIGYCVLEVSC